MLSYVWGWIFDNERPDLGGRLTLPPDMIKLVSVQGSCNFTNYDAAYLLAFVDISLCAAELACTMPL